MTGAPSNGRVVFVSAVTLGNALCGLLGCAALMLAASSFTRSIALAAGCVFAGFVLDRLDGTLARRLGVSSPLGAQLDSLCDVLSFGLLPALLIVAPALPDSSPAIVMVRIVVAMAYLAAAIVRLARFTLAATDVPGAAPMLPISIAGERHYRGLPSPAAAMAVAAVVLLEVFGTYGTMVEGAPLPSLSGHAWLTLLAGVAAAIAMVKPWPYADPPRAFVSGQWPRLLLVVLIAIGVAAGPFTAMTAFAFAYLVTGPILARRGDLNGRAVAPVREVV